MRAATLKAIRIAGAKAKCQPAKANPRAGCMKQMKPLQESPGRRSPLFPFVVEIAG
jgi:hypothetical protein